MDRKEFLKYLGLGSAALMALYCLGSVTACSSETPLPDVPVDFTLDLAQPDNAPLLTNGGFVTRDSVIVARTNAGNFVALSRICTHEQSNVTFQANQERFYCPTHGSLFALNGSVLQGPANRALRQYQTRFDSSANRLRVFA